MIVKKVANIAKSLSFNLMKSLVFAVFILLFSLKSYAYEAKAGMTVLSLGPVVHYRDFRSVPDSYYDSAKYGVAIVAEAVFQDDWAIEFGLFNLRNLYLREEADRYLVERVRRLHITTGVRRWWSKYVSTGLVFSSAFAMGNVDTIDSFGPVDDSFQTLATRDKAVTYGIVASLRFEFDFNKRDGLFLDLRYSYSLSAEGKDEANGMVAGIFYKREISL